MDLIIRMIIQIKMGNKRNCYYKVTNDFPKIVGSQLSSGIDDVY